MEKIRVKGSSQWGSLHSKVWRTRSRVWEQLKVSGLIFCLVSVGLCFYHVHDTVVVDLSTSDHAGQKRATVVLWDFRVAREIFFSRVCGCAVAYVLVVRTNFVTDKERCAGWPVVLRMFLKGKCYCSAILKSTLTFSAVNWLFTIFESEIMALFDPYFCPSFLVAGSV